MSYLELAKKAEEALKKQKRQVAGSVDPALCWNCGATMTPTQDIYGNHVFVCWSCAKSA